MRGVGPKTAVALLQAFGSVEALYERLDEVAGLPLRGAKSVQARLERDREAAFLSKRLSEVARDAPVQADLSALRFGGADPALVEPLFARLGIEGLRGRIPGYNPAS